MAGHHSNIGMNKMDTLFSVRNSVLQNDKIMIY